MAATLLTLLFVNFGSGCATCAVSQGPPVVLPKPGASADAVVRAYLAAVQARDHDAVRALSAPSYYERVHHWPTDPIGTWADVKISEVGEPTPDEYGPGGYRQVRRVYVDIEVRRCNEEPPDDDRHFPYTFLVGRQSDDAPWRVIDFGGLT
ncbi:hypothetical protein [Nonomuraea sp. NPDC050786]|uniref:hypothetical protein n=1 Tax=Nonomuraea sp. NPDC050786 TaxID=3154840 RepID=UPI0033E8F723